jgi:hypothetical protein
VKKASAVTVARQSKQRARELLDRGNNRLWLIIAITLWIATAGTVYMLGGGLVYAADESILTAEPSMLAVGLSLLSYALMLVLALALLVPMAGSVVLLARYVYEGRELEAVDLFAAFGSLKQYFLCMRLGLYSLGYPVLIIAAAVLGVLVAPSVIAQAVTDAIAPIAGEQSAMYVLSYVAFAGMLVIGVGLTFLVFYLCRTAYLKTALMARGMSLRRAKAYTATLLAKSECGSLIYHFSFAGHVALAILTFGAAAVAHGIPFALLSHQFACDCLKIQEK